MATIYELACLARQAYRIEDNNSGKVEVLAEDGYKISGWTVAARLVAPFSWTSPIKAFAPPGISTGAQAYFFSRNLSGEKETVLAIKGTKPYKSGDLVADLKIGLGIITNQASAVKSFYKKHQQAYPNVTVIGHSLGGGLAQCLGYWFDLPFVTFNAPGMMGSLKQATGNWMKPQVMMRTIKAEKRHTAQGGGIAGINIRMENDVVSKVSTTYGKQVTLDGGGWAGSAHLMNAIMDGLGRQPDVANSTLADLL